MKETTVDPETARAKMMDEFFAIGTADRGARELASAAFRSAKASYFTALRRDAAERGLCEACLVEDHRNVRCTLTATYAVDYQGRRYLWCDGTYKNHIDSQRRGIGADFGEPVRL